MTDSVGRAATPTGHVSLPRVVIGALAMGQLLVSLDSSVANVALPRIQQDLNASVGQLQWIVIAYVVAGAALALPIGAAGDTWDASGSTWPASWFSRSGRWRQPWRREPMR